MLKASIEIEVTTSTNPQHPDPHNFWTVRLISKTGDTIKQIVEQVIMYGNYKGGQDEETWESQTPAGQL